MVFPPSTQVRAQQGTVQHTAQLMFFSAERGCCMDFHIRRRLRSLRIQHAA